MSGGADTAAIKAAGAVGGVALAAPTVVLGIGLETLIAATAGALFSIAYSRPDVWGRLLELPTGPLGRRVVIATGRALLLALTMGASAVVGAWLVYAIPGVPGFLWVGQIPQPPLAGLLAFGCQHWIPRLLSLGERIIDGRAPK